MTSFSPWEKRINISVTSPWSGMPECLVNGMVELVENAAYVLNIEIIMPKLAV